MSSKLQSVKHLVIANTQALSEMLDILKKEYDVLKGSNYDALEAIINKKSAQATKLEDLEKQMKTMFSMTENNNLLERFDTFLKQVADPSDKKSLQIIWNQLLDTIDQCHEQNRINHRIVEASKTNIQQTLDILRGDSALPKLYGSSGKKDNDQKGHSLAVA